MTATTAPAYIAPDTYTGRWTRQGNKIRSDVFTAAELAAMVAPDATLVVWEYFGTVRGLASYHRTRFVAQADGSLVGYSASGACTIIHPAGRRIRVMTR